MRSTCSVHFMNPLSSLCAELVEPSGLSSTPPGATHGTRPGATLRQDAGLHGCMQLRSLPHCQIAEHHCVRIAQGGSTEGPSELEVKHGLCSIVDTLNFMHTSCKLAHCNLSPESIIVAADGTWKLAGLHFASPISPSGASRCLPTRASLAYSVIAAPAKTFAALCLQGAWLYRDSA